MVETEQFDAARKRLWDELVGLHDSWAQYTYLFAESEERVEILNACARWFFALTQRILFREVLLAISRLTDPVKSGGFDNLVIGTLLLDPRLREGQEELRSELQAAVATALAASAPIRVHRNKYIAHLDHATVMGSSESPIPGLTRDTISSAVQALEKVYNLHGSRLHESHAIFELSPMGGSDALIRILEKSERWKRMRDLRRGPDSL